METYICATRNTGQKNRALPKKRYGDSDARDLAHGGAQKKAKLDSRDGVLGTKEHATGREVAQVGSENRTEL